MFLSKFHQLFLAVLKVRFLLPQLIIQFGNVVLQVLNNPTFLFQLDFIHRILKQVVLHFPQFITQITYRIILLCNLLLFLSNFLFKIYSHLLFLFFLSFQKLRYLNRILLLLNTARCLQNLQLLITVFLGTSPLQILHSQLIYFFLQHLYSLLHLHSRLPILQLFLNQLLLRFILEILEFLSQTLVLYFKTRILFANLRQRFNFQSQFFQITILFLIGQHNLLKSINLLLFLLPILDTPYPLLFELQLQSANHLLIRQFLIKYKRLQLRYLLFTKVNLLLHTPALLFVLQVVCLQIFVILLHATFLASQSMHLHLQLINLLLQTQDLALGLRQLLLLQSQHLSYSLRLFFYAQRTFIFNEFDILFQFLYLGFE